MSTLFADTAYYIALLNPRDKNHEVAHELSRGYHGRVLTTKYVLVELGNH